LQPRVTSSLSDTKEAQCVVDVCTNNSCITGKRKTCVIKMPLTNGNFVNMKAPRKKVRNETKFISHRCHHYYSKNEMHPLATCHDKMWNLVYTSAQLEGEALLKITLNLKPNNQVSSF